MLRSGSEDPISVMLVDDHLLVRRGFRRMLEDDPGIRVVGEASDGRRRVDIGHARSPASSSWISRCPA